MRTPSEQSPAGRRPPSGWTNLTIVRHACAGDERAWPGDDSQRPLDAVGIRQAAALADAFTDNSVQRLVASPTKRCTDTLAPLAERLHLEIETTRELSPGGSIELLLSDRHQGWSDTIFCTHGELMRPFLQRLQANRVQIDAERGDDEWLLLKGSVWRLMLDPYGQVAKLTHETPLRLAGCEASTAFD